MCVSQRSIFFFLWSLHMIPSAVTTMTCVDDLMETILKFPASEVYMEWCSSLRERLHNTRYLNTLSVVTYCVTKASLSRLLHQKKTLRDWNIGRQRLSFAAIFYVRNPNTAPEERYNGPRLQTRVEQTFGILQSRFRWQTFHFFFQFLTCSQKYVSSWNSWEEHYSFVTSVKSSLGRLKWSLFTDTQW